jgi:hypothetical protein
MFKSVVFIVLVSQVPVPAQSPTPIRDVRTAEQLRRRYVELTDSWAKVRFTDAEQAAMRQGKQWESIMTKGPDDPLARRVLAAGEPTYAALASLYPGKILDRTVLGSYSDPSQKTSGYDDEFAIYWNGAIAANLLKGEFVSESGNASVRPIGHNTIVTFHIGTGGELFGTDRNHFTGMRYENGYLPLVTGAQSDDGLEYSETAFAAKPQGETGGWDVAYVAFDIRNRSGVTKTSHLEARLTLLRGGSVRLLDGKLVDADGATVMTAAGDGLDFDRDRGWLRYHADLAPGRVARIVFKIPFVPDSKGLLRAASAANFDRMAAQTRRFWGDLLAKGAQIDVPESRVNDVWKALLLQNFVLTDGPRFTYGSGLVYNDSTFPQENGFGALVFALYGHSDFANALQRGFVGMCVTPEGAGRKYQNRRAMVLHHLLENYRLTGKTDLFEDFHNDYYRVADQIVAERHSTMTPIQGEKPLYWGLLPPDKPGVDVQASTQSVYVPGHNITNCQGLQDFGEFLVSSGLDPRRGREYLNEAADFRRVLMSAMERAAIHLPDRPPFVDLQTLLFRQTPDYGPDPYDDLALGRLQGTYLHYWVDMELHYNFFNPDDAVGEWLADYVQQRNGFVLGCTRARPQTNGHYGWTNNVYDAGYYDYRLRRGEVDRFLLGLYSRLAFGMTRNLYVSAEGSPFIGYNTENGGFVSANLSFPNSASNADTLLMLRNALVMEELRDNRETGTLFVLRGAPGAWFEYGKRIHASHMPTYFGPVSIEVTSRLHSREITARVQVSADSKCHRVWVYFRNPHQSQMRTVWVNGIQWTDCDFRNGIVRVDPKGKALLIKVEY